MARRVISLDEKIRKAEAAVASAKAKYDAALDELEKLVTKRKSCRFHLKDSRRILMNAQKSCETSPACDHSVVPE